MPELQKDAINPHFKNKYISLESLMPKVLEILRKHKILLTQFPSTGVTGEPALTTQLTFVGGIAAEERGSGSYMESTVPLILDKQTPQAVGSAITYMRRYAILSALGLVADVDDDAEEATTSRRDTTRGAARSSGF